MQLVDVNSRINIIIEDITNDMAFSISIILITFYHVILPYTSQYKLPYQPSGTF